MVLTIRFFINNKAKERIETLCVKGNYRVCRVVFPQRRIQPRYFEEGLRRYNGLSKLEDGQWMQFKKILCVQNGTIVHEEKL